ATSSSTTSVLAPPAPRSPARSSRRTTAAPATAPATSKGTNGVSALTSRRSNHWRALVPAKLIAYLAVANAHEAIDFYERAFGAVEQSRIEENGRIGHAELHIGDDAFYLSDEWPEMKVLGPDKLPG